MLTLLFVACSGGVTPADSSADSDADCVTDAGLAPQPDEDHLDEFRPVVVDTEPQAGDQAVDPGLTEIRVTFSKDMADLAWSWVQVSARQFPETGDAAYEDERTNVLEVSLEPDHTYVLWINYDPDYMSFQDESGNTALPYQLAFHTAPE